MSNGPFSLLDELAPELPMDLLRPVIILVVGIVRVVLAGSDPQKRGEALMKSAEDVKAEMDRQKFGVDGPQG